MEDERIKMLEAQMQELSAIVAVHEQMLLALLRSQPDAVRLMANFGSIAWRQSAHALGLPLSEDMLASLEKHQQRWKLATQLEPARRELFSPPSPDPADSSP